jgi:hypothetical protein
MKGMFPAAQKGSMTLKISKTACILAVYSRILPEPRRLFYFQSQFKFQRCGEKTFP